MGIFLALFLLLLLALQFAGAATAQVDKEEQSSSWFNLELPSFHVYSSNASEAVRHNSKAANAIKKKLPSLSMSSFISTGMTTLSMSSFITTGVTTLTRHEKASTDLDGFEKKLSSAYDVVKKLTPYLKASLGTTLLMNGGKLANTALVMQALSIAGLPAIKKSIKELRHAYKRGRKQMQEELPTLVAAQKDVPTIVGKTEQLMKDMKKIREDADMKLSELKSRFDAKKINAQVLEKEKAALEDLFLKKKTKIQKDIDDLNQSKQKILAASSSMKTILSALNPDHLKNVLLHSYSSVLSTLAVTKSVTAQKVTRGLHFANVIQDKITSFYKEDNLTLTRFMKDVSVPGVPSSVLEKGSTWLGSMVHSTAAAGGVYLSFFMKDMAQSYSVSILGSDLLLRSLEEILDPVCKKFQLPSIGRMPPMVKTIVHSGVAWVAVAKQTALAHRLPNNGPIFKLLLKVEDAITGALF